VTHTYAFVSIKTRALISDQLSMTEKKPAGEKRKGTVRKREKE